MSQIAERYEAVRRRVRDAADCAGRDADDITIVAVAKTVGPPEVRAAIAAGVTDFGENRVQEFVAKRGLFPDVRWHFIGTLQSNKAQHVVGSAALIHSVDSLSLLERIDRIAGTRGVVQPVLLQVNISHEASKHGIDRSEVEEMLTASIELPNVRVKGLMTIAPLQRAEGVRWVFRDMRTLFESLGGMRFNGVELTELSMGMTNDFEVAIEEGATIVRIGRAIFGR
ncbi:YggS family pyridoxal phosphate-dependent enzyme [Anaerosoma tenue]|uniref:YggS family pyridoxal phosphate-dependent enzyme n=1 Tax=Anaerosoma tenue TaxID=2933588 RepID=UPI002260F3E3|nr:YggS family pyridoxal phosphate-dependent enzyme [Anaerosoma tenue]MCK8114355.1 YggS family pyridoxal phosphate-dependent enzyme [Anaerosoma tenue]